MIQPTIGRKVWYWPGYGNAKQPMDATVCYVHDDHTVNLLAVTHEGVPLGKLRVPLVQDGEPKPEVGPYCEWMPYQKGQAAKTEEAESALVDRLVKQMEPVIERMATELINNLIPPSSSQ